MSEVWDASVPPGGFVCSICGWPSESEPCEHLAATAHVPGCNDLCDGADHYLIATIDSIWWSDDEGPRSVGSWACCDGNRGWHWHPEFVQDHQEAEDRVKLGLFDPHDVRPDRAIRDA